MRRPVELLLREVGQRPLERVLLDDHHRVEKHVGTLVRHSVWSLILATSRLGATSVDAGGVGRPTAPILSNRARSMPRGHRMNAMFTPAVGASVRARLFAMS